MQTRIHDTLSAVAAAKPNALAIIDHADGKFTWSELATATAEAKQVLQGQGVKPGDRVVMVFENCLSVCAFIFATSQLDAISVPLNARLTHAELDRLITHSDPSVVIFCNEASDTAVIHGKAFSAKPAIGRYGTVGLFQRKGSQPEPSFEDGAEQVALLLYTSGTTGVPKAAMLTHDNLLCAASASAKVRGMQDDDMTFMALPLSHIFGFVTFLAICKAQGAMRLEARFSVERLYSALQSDVTLLPAVPQMHAHLFHYAKAQDKPRYDAGLLRFVSSGGAPLDPVWKREAEAFYGLPLQNGYGLTEGAAGVCATSSPLGDPDVSVGYPMERSLFRLDFDAEGATPAEGIGEILVGGPQIMKGYFRDPEQTAKVLTEDGYFRTGDLGRFDADKRLHIAGRSKELIIRSGFNVYPVEVEAALTDHPEVIMAGVVGRPAAGNEEVLAFVKVPAKCSLTEAELSAFVKDKLAPYKRPTRIIIAKDLPAAPTGKILKAKLISTFADELMAETTG
ncbi:class I adenylate-forming enzyme family protein [Pseudophaeobacter sp.]|uniref:class I adenylate-forming enzyme family protein n=1 Tax=Pseudophaeobacter sp. TaxID=1971739 RepID=UPI003299A53C